MKIPLFYVDAFTQEVFKGNPAAVCLLESWLPVEVLQSIASEHNLSETAFVVREEKETFQLKWFTPKTEVSLCGHATLATAHVLFSIYSFANKPIRFKTKSGVLPVRMTRGGVLTLDFPVEKYEKYHAPDMLSEAIGGSFIEAYKSASKLMLVFRNQQEIENLNPDFQRIKNVENGEVIVTAPGKGCDFVSRFFAPGVGINEDPVTGSAHCMLVPYWAERIQKTTLHARQLSERTGELLCELAGDRVMISGQAVTYMQGTINISITPPNNLVAY